MRYVIKFAAILVVSWLVVWQLGVADDMLLQQEEVRMCANGKRSNFGYCPEDVKTDNSRLPSGYTKPRVVTGPKRRPVGADDCDASRPPKGGENPCRPKSVSTVPPSVITGTGDLISGRYRDNGDGTVTDITTKLMWKRCAEGQTWTRSTCVGNAQNFVGSVAMPNDRQKSWNSFAGHADWRVPSRSELVNLVYCSNGKPKKWNNTGDSCDSEYYDKPTYERPTIDTIAFPNTPKTLFLSSSIGSTPAGYKWTISFHDGFDSDSFGGEHCIRLVRDDQPSIKILSKDVRSLKRFIFGHD